VYFEISQSIWSTRNTRSFLQTHDPLDVPMESIRPYRVTQGGSFGSTCSSYDDNDHDDEYTSSESYDSDTSDSYSDDDNDAGSDSSSEEETQFKMDASEAEIQRNIAAINDPSVEKRCFACRDLAEMVDDENARVFCNALCIEQYYTLAGNQLKKKKGKKPAKPLVPKFGGITKPSKTKKAKEVAKKPPPKHVESHPIKVPEKHTVAKGDASNTSVSESGAPRKLKIPNRKKGSRSRRSKKTLPSYLQDQLKKKQKASDGSQSKGGNSTTKDKPKPSDNTKSKDPIKKKKKPKPSDGSQIGDKPKPSDDTKSKDPAKKDNGKKKKKPSPTDGSQSKDPTKKDKGKKKKPSPIDDSESKDPAKKKKPSDPAKKDKQKTRKEPDEPTREEKERVAREQRLQDKYDRAKGRRKDAEQRAQDEREARIRAEAEASAASRGGGTYTPDYPDRSYTLPNGGGGNGRSDAGPIITVPVVTRRTDIIGDDGDNERVTTRPPPFSLPEPERKPVITDTDDDDARIVRKPVITDPVEDGDEMRETIIEDAVIPVRQTPDKEVVTRKPTNRVDKTRQRKRNNRYSEFGARDEEYWRQPNGFGYGLWWHRRYPWISRYVSFAKYFPQRWLPYYIISDDQNVAVYEYGDPIDQENVLVDRDLFGSAIIPPLTTFAELGVDSDILHMSMPYRNKLRTSERMTIRATLRRVDCEIMRMRADIDLLSYFYQGFMPVPDFDRESMVWVKRV
jgi:hypothetical protein